MKREMDGEELWVRAIIKFILVVTFIWIVAKLVILTISFQSPL
jgi:hypothetical protein